LSQITLALDPGYAIRAAEIVCIALADFAGLLCTENFTSRPLGIFMHMH
jgi:hypothetical protein